MEQLIFGWSDFFFFGSLLGISLIVGIYFGFCSKQDSVNEYLFGGRRMGFIPVALSTIASAASGITFLGIPTEVYLHGFQFIFVNINAVLVGLITAYIFIPVFYKLQVASVFEYLEMRFSRKIRSFGSILYIMSLGLYIPIVIYVPGLAVSQVTGYSLHLITTITCAFCIAYTSVGGVKAVVWTDTIQFIFTMGGFFSVFILGISSLGLGNIWKTAHEGGRLDIFDFNPSPFVRHTFWAMTLGSLFPSLSHAAIGQKFIQRFLAIESQADINKAVLLKTIGIMIPDSCCAFLGLIIYAKYHDCDPQSAKLVERSDQIVPYYVMDTTRHLPGMAGIFLAGIVSSALSAMSAGINTLSGLLYDDFIDQYIPESPNKQAKAANIMKMISVLVGITSIGLIFVIEHLGTVIEITYSIRGAIDGPILGFFILGMFFPWVGKKGAMAGGCMSIAFMSWIVIGSRWHILNNRIRYPTLPMTTENCTNFGINVTENVTLPPIAEEDEPMILYQISFLYFVLFGTLITVFGGLAYSLLTGESDTSKVDIDHITPVVQRFFRKKKYIEVSMNEIPEEKNTPERSCNR